MKFIRQTIVLGLMGVLLASCAPGAGFPITPGVDQSAQTETPVHPGPMPGTLSPAASPTPYPTPQDAGLQGQVQLAKQDLAERLGISIEEVELADLQAVVWPDAGLGCPQPGISYIQVEQDGLLLRLRARSQVYQYHSGAGRPPFLCEQALIQPPVTEVPLAPIQLTPVQEVKVTEHPVIPTPADPGSGSLVSIAKEDLAGRLGVPVEEIDLVEFQAVTWPDGSLGCPQPGMGYIQILIEGVRIRLRAAGQIYNYHSGGNRPPFLCENPQEPYMPSGTVDK